MFTASVRLLLLPSMVLLHGLAAWSFAATPATVAGKVLDGEGVPWAQVGVTVRGGEFEVSATTDKKGRFKATVPDATLQYEIQIAREGYPVFSDALTFPKGGSYSMEFKMNATPIGSATGSMVALRSFNAGAQAYNDGDFDLALLRFGEAVSADPEFKEAYSVIATVHHAREQHEQASLAADRVLALEPDNVAALRIRYLADEELGRDGASAILDRLAELDRSPQTAVLLYNDGVAARVAGDQQRALARYELACRIDPTFAAALAALAGIQLERKDYDAALEGSARVLELDAENARGLSVRYNALIALGRNDEARATLEALQKAAPDAVAGAFFERGAALFDDGLIDRAIPALEQALEADPNLAQGHYTIALCYMNRDRNEEARHHLETFVRLAPDDPNVDAADKLIEVLSRTD